MSKRLALLVILLLAPLIPTRPVVAAPPQAPRIDKSEPFGLVATIANRVRTDEQPAAISLLREAGVQWVREEIFWHKLQPQRGGAYQWRGNAEGLYNYDASITGLQKAGIKILGLLDYGPAWFAGQSPMLDEWINDWGDYVYNTVARYGREGKQIKHWEIWNEPNLRISGFETGLYSVKDYVRLLHVSRAAAKAADPEAQIVLGGVASIWSEITKDNEYDTLSYLQLLHDAGGWDTFDILGLHPYRPAPPEGAPFRREAVFDINSELNAIDELNQRFGAKPIWMTEVGWSTFEGYYGVSLDDQAAYLVRMYLMSLAHPMVERLFWYDFRDDTDPDAPYQKPVYNPRYHEFHFGLIRRQYPLDVNRPNLRKPAFMAFRTMHEVLAGTTLSGVFKDGNDPQTLGTYAYRYDGAGRAAMVLWRTTAEAAPYVTFPCDCTTAHVRNTDGRLLAVVVADGQVTVRLDLIGTPLYVEWGNDRTRDGPFFPPTGHHISQPFLAYWQANGGLAQFGYPISGPVTEPEHGTGRPKLVQYFERNRFEYDPSKRGTPFAVQIGRLGDDALQLTGVDWTRLPKEVDAPEGCVLFPETGHRMCEPFRSYWEQHGGLAINGLPLTEAFDQSGMLVQYFERARFEYHTTPDGTTSYVELGLLGNELYRKYALWP